MVEFFPLMNQVFLLEYWGSVWQNAIGCTVGSFLAVFFSYLIYRFGLKKTEELKYREQDRERADSLKYFSELVSNIIETTHQQIAMIEEFREQIGTYPAKFELMTVLPIYDFKRVSENLFLDKLMLSFTSKGDGSVKEFRKIIIDVDYLTTEFSFLPEQMKSGRLIYEGLVEELYKLTLDCGKTINNYLLSLEKDSKHADALFQFLESTKGDSLDIKDAHGYHNLYIEPLNKVLIGIIQSCREVELLRLHSITMEAKKAFDRIQKQNLLIADEFGKISAKAQLVLIAMEKDTEILFAMTEKL